jgi:hypothetical protein
MQKSVWGKREEASGLYCGPCAEVSFGVKRKVFVDLGEICVGCLSRVIEGDEVKMGDDTPEWVWRPATNIERMAAAVKKGGEKAAKQGRCKCRGPRRLCKCAGKGGK